MSLLKITERRKKRMKSRVMKKVRKIAVLAFAVMLLGSAPMMEAEAAQQADVTNEKVEEIAAVEKEVSEEEFFRNPQIRTALYNCLINVGCSSDGMYVEFVVNADDTASVIGIKDIKIQKKVWYGWKTVVTSKGAETYNAGIFGCSLLYKDAEYGETYRITCVHYADVDGYNELENEIDSFVFTY